MPTLPAFSRLFGPVLASLVIVLASPAVAIDFGDDTGKWANDGECDDPRFTGPGMTSTTLLESDILHDATDCRQAHNAGRVTFKKPDQAAPEAVAAPPADDPRLGGQGSKGQGPSGQAASANVEFGDDASRWANDGECDDPRFTGAGAAATLLDSDRLHDATDCRRALETGQISLKSSGDLKPQADRPAGPIIPAPQAESPSPAESPAPQAAIPAPASVNGAVNFGDDLGRWAKDGECDDPRFQGEGMTATALLKADNGHDATDCRAAFEAGKLTLK